MKKLLNTKTKLIVAIALVVIVLTWLALFFFARELAVSLWRPILFALLFVGLAWIGVHYGLKAWRKRKNKAFDEAVAAKEGIEDRKREWAGWNEELDKQGIDRYELPFYLLVGEPQSGKSVLLHNSDLHFPFGQTRLSGIGGTRGCDWWFTEEAVILDLAGRLFTHEGGAADRLEWEAFLDLLSEFRPLCPANGVMLVIPCDGLLAETPDQCSAKANKIQAALLTLTGKLQAQLPVYLVLTKGDKVFGFAESVHRLDVERRHEMFGWSRPSEKIEAPFDMAEVRAGFDGMVVRAELLRAQMLSTARLPEALPEIDRMYAFPEELAGVWSNLEVYLRRIFTESGLVDRLYFRGVYLTSGLQTGVPVAKVCNELFGRAGEADARNLEALFSKQRAYFIKDLVRKRVFAERGLVRPTKGRVLKARRSAVIGYGASAALVLLSILFSIVYLARDRKGTPRVEAYDQAVASAERVSRSSNAPIPEVLGALERARHAVDQPVELLEGANFSPQDRFRELFVSLFDRRLLPRLRPLILSELGKSIESAPRSYSEFKDLCGSVALLLEDVDLSDPDTRGLLLRWVPMSERSAPGGAGGKPLELEGAFGLRVQYGDDDGLRQPTAKSDANLLALAKKARVYLESCLEPGTPFQPDGEFGYLLAWKGVDTSRKGFQALKVDNTQVFELCRLYRTCLERLDALELELPIGDGGKRKVQSKSIWLDLFRLKGTYRTPIRDYIHASGESVPEVWSQANWITAWVKECFDGEEDGGISLAKWGLNLGSEDALVAIFEMGEVGAAGLSAWIDVPDERHDALRDPLLLRKVCAEPLTADWKLEGLAAAIQSGLRDGRGLTGSGLPDVVFRAQCLAIQRSFLARFGTPQDALDALAEPAETVLSRRLVQALDPLRAQVIALGDSAEDRALFADWLERIEDLLEKHLDAARLSGGRVLELEDGAQAIPEEIWDLLGSLQRVASLKDVGSQHSLLPATASTLRMRCLGDSQSQVLEGWRRPWDSRERMSESLKVIAGHAAELAKSLGPEGLETLKQDPDDQRFRRQVDELIGTRLELFARALLAAWGADRAAIWNASISQSASATKSQIDRLGSKLQGARDAGSGLVPRIVSQLGPASRPDDWLASTGLKARKALEDLATLSDATEQDVRSEDSVIQFLGLLEQVNRDPGRFGNGTDQARLYRDFFGGGELPAPTNGGVRYVMFLRSAFRDNLLRRVQEAYVRALQEALEDQRIAPAIDALYAQFGGTEPAKNDPLVIGGLDVLLKRGGVLEGLRADYFGGQPGSAGFADLRPPLERELPEGEREWWQFEAFLTELQAFLLPGKAKNVASGSFSVTIKPESTRKDSLWDPRMSGRGWKNYFFHPDDDRGGWKAIVVGEDMDIAPLKWSLQPGADKKLRMKWSKRFDAANSITEDEAWLAVPGSLAPLLLAWSGQRDEEDTLIWRLELEPRQPAGDTRLSAPMVFAFDAPLPQRPLDPRGGE